MSPFDPQRPVIQMDTREKEGKKDAILAAFEAHGLSVEHRKLDTGDYAIQADQAPDHGLSDMDFSREEKQKVLIWAGEESAFLRETLGLSDIRIESLYEDSLNKQYDYLEFQKFEKNFGKILNTLE